MSQAASYPSPEPRLGMSAVNFLAQEEISGEGQKVLRNATPAPTPPGYTISGAPLRATADLGGLSSRGQNSSRPSLRTPVMNPAPGRLVISNPAVAGATTP